jgi:hypothetical protein
MGEGLRHEAVGDLSMSLLFHGSFGLHRARMAGILKAGLENPSANDADLARPFEYRAPFAAKYRSWLHKTGIAEQGLPLRLTQLGEVAWKLDPNFESQVTMAFMHHQLTGEPGRAEAWYFFCRQFLPQHRDFTREDVLTALAENLRVRSERRPGSAIRQTGLIVRKLLECYTQDYALGGLGILQSKKNRYLRLDVNLPCPWQTEAELELAYNRS